MTLIEMVIIVAVLGILLGIGLVVLPNDHAAVSQAANGFARQFPRARIEALKSDKFAGIAVSTSGDGSYYVCVDQNDDRQCSTSEAVQTVDMGKGANSKVRLASTSSGFTQFMFDPRGIPMSAGGSVTFSNAAGTYSVTVAFTAAGEASVQ
ncbi:MAG: GspH/FimT family protein [Deinococcales bacterium]